MENLLQDLRYGIRMLLKKPSFSLVAIIALALGIGANTAIFSVVNAVLLRPLPYEKPDQLVWVWEINPKSDIQQEPASAPNYADWKSQNQSFEDMTAFGRSLPILTSGSGEPERLPGGAVAANFFSVLGAHPLMGRTFMPHEDQRGSERVAVLSHGLWTRRFGADPNILGTTITLNGISHSVIGIMPAGFRHPLPGDRRAAEIWTPIVLNLDPQTRRSDFLSVIARLKPGVTVDEARSEMVAIAGSLEQQYPDTNEGWSVRVLPLHERFVGDVRPALIVLLAAVGFLLLIACANVANLLLTRASSRQKEMAIRTALGARRIRIVRQLLTESLLLAIGGGVLGLLLSVWGIDVLLALSPGNIPRLGEVGLDSRVLLFTFFVSIITGVVFGLLPAWQASSPHLNESLKDGGRSSAQGVSGQRLRGLLVVAEVALSLILLIGAGLMVRSFIRLQDVNPGFNAERLLTIELALPPSRYPESQKVTSFYEQLMERVRAVPGVEEVAMANYVPMAARGADYLGFSIEGRPPLPSDPVMDVQSYVVSTEYFRAMGIPLLRGRLLGDEDTQGAPVAIVINDVMARRYWPDEDPVGKRVTFGDPQTGPWVTIVGICGGVRQEGLGKELYPQAYRSYKQAVRRGMTLLARASGDPINLVAGIRGEIKQMDPEQPLYNIRPMAQMVSQSIAPQRFNMLLISIFAVVAIVLAAVGIYGVMSYSVTQRTHEIGVRMALGARPGDVLRLIVGNGMKLTLAGVATGLAGSFLLTRFMATLLYGVSSSDVVTFLSVSVLLAIVSLVACYLPACRAMKVDPMIALRYE